MRTGRTALVKKIPVIDLRDAPGARTTWDRPMWVVFLWRAMELLLVRNSWQVSSRVRAQILRLFGAKVGRHVILRPGLRVQFPWKLCIGDNSWLGEDVWIHNQDYVQLASDVVISQGTFITTGSHAHRRDMSLITKSILVEAGVWVTARCVILGGTRIGTSSVIGPNCTVTGTIPPNSVFTAPTPIYKGQRFSKHEENATPN